VGTCSAVYNAVFSVPNANQQPFCKPEKGYSCELMVELVFLSCPAFPAVAFFDVIFRRPMTGRL
jgi:hypothetical protein